MFKFQIYLLICLEFLDIILTKVFLTTDFSFSEANILAKSLYNHFGFFGVIFFKLFFVTIAILTLLKIKEKSPKTALKTVLFINLVLILTSLSFLAI